VVPGIGTLTNPVVEVGQKATKNAFA
jgi:hypothetical protein